jgi:hypothetical protein
VFARRRVNGRAQDLHLGQVVLKGNRLSEGAERRLRHLVSESLTRLGVPEPEREHLLDQLHAHLLRRELLLDPDQGGQPGELMNGPGKPTGWIH